MAGCEGQHSPDIAVLPLVEENLTTVISDDLPPGHQLVFERMSHKRIETGETIQERISGRWSEYAHQRAARPYTKLSADEPWIYHEEIRSEPVDDDVILEVYRIIREPNIEPVDYSDPDEPVKVTEEIRNRIELLESRTASSDGTDTGTSGESADGEISVIFRLKNVPRFDRPLPPAELSTEEEKAETWRSRNTYDEDRRNRILELAQPVLSDLMERGITDITEMGGGFFQVNLRISDLWELTNDRRLRSVDIANRELRDDGCDLDNDVGLAPNETMESFLGDFTNGKRVDAEAFYRNGYNGSIANNSRHSAGKLVASVAECGQYETDSPSVSSGRVLNRYVCSTSQCVSDATVECEDPTTCGNWELGTHGTGVMSILFGNYAHSGSSNLALGDQCWLAGSSGHCEGFYQRTNGVATGAGSYYFRVSDNFTSCLNNSRAKAIQKSTDLSADVMNISSGLPYSSSGTTRCDIDYNDTLDAAKAEDAFDDGVFIINSTGNFGSDEINATPSQPRSQCALNYLATRPKVFSVGSLFARIPEYSNRATWGGVPPQLNYAYEELEYRDNSCFWPLNPDDYENIRRDSFGAQAGGIDVYINESQYMSALTGVDLLAPPGDAFGSTNIDGPNGEAANTFGQSSGAAPFVAGSAILVKHWLLARTGDWINSPGRLHTLMLGMGDNSFF